jgi:DNA topoisomerase-1
LGKEYTVEASIGPIRDLPEGAKEVPEQFKGLPWARLGVNVDDNFTPIYIVPHEKKSQVAKLKQLLKGAGALFLATDEDREGRSVGICARCKPGFPSDGFFHEITKEAIRTLEHPRDRRRARRAQTRAFSIGYGYEVSPLLWKKVKPKLGRPSAERGGA